MSRIPLIQLPAPRAERPNDPLEEKTFKEEVLFNSSFVKMVRDDIKLPDASGVIRSSAASGNCPREK